MRDGAEVLEGSVFLLEREAHGVAFTVYFYFLGLDLDGLSAAHRLDEGAGDTDARTGSDLRQKLL